MPQQRGPLWMSPVFVSNLEKTSSALIDVCKECCCSFHILLSSQIIHSNLVSFHELFSSYVLSYLFGYSFTLGVLGMNPGPCSPF